MMEQGSSSELQMQVNRPDSSPTSTEDVDIDNYRCGWLTWRPRLLRRLMTSRWLLICLSGLSISAGISINGFTNVSISSIERRFELSSSQTSLLPVTYEISSSILIIIIGYFFAHGNKPRLIAGGGILVGIGCILFTLPHFLTDKYLYQNTGNDTTDLCPNQERSITCEKDESGGTSVSSLSKYMYVFVLGQIFLGIGNAPANALQKVFLDESVKAKNIGLYLGIDGAMSNLASAVGFIAGGITLEVLYTDFMQVDTERLGLNSSDSKWVGAWWLGFLVCAAGAFFWSFLVSCFPLQMPGSKKYHKERQGQEQKVAGLERASQPGFGVTFSDIPGATLILFRNPLYIFITLTNIADISFLAGAEVFLPKYIEVQFSLTAGKAAITTGVIVTVFGCSALMIGGWLIRKLNLQVEGMLKICLGSNIACAILLFTLFFRCAEVQLAGVNVPYLSNNGVFEVSGDLQPACNSYCNCSLSQFSPVCSSTGITYFSACHAGCQVFDHTTKQYSNCSCESARNEVVNPSSAGSVTPGTCGETCVQFYIFSVCLSCIVFVYLLTGTPRSNVMLRIVPFRLRAYSSALNSLIVRLLGSITGAVIFGRILDSACILWNEECGIRGRCLYYDRSQLALWVILYGVGMKIVAIVCFILAIVTYRPRGEANIDSQKTLIREMPLDLVILSIQCNVTKTAPAGGDQNNIRIKD